MFSLHAQCSCNFGYESSANTQMKGSMACLAGSADTEFLEALDFPTRFYSFPIRSPCVCGCQVSRTKPFMLETASLASSTVYTKSSNWNRGGGVLFSRILIIYRQTASGLATINGAQQDLTFR